MTVEGGQERLLRYLEKLENMVEAMDIPEILSAAILHSASYYRGRREHSPFECSIEEIRRAISVRGEYKEEFVEKKGGGKRRLLIPHPELKVVQSKIWRFLKYIWPSFSLLKVAPYKLYGFGYTYLHYENWETGSYVDYAICHKDSNWFFQFDLKNAFPSVNIERLRKILFLRFQQGMHLEVQTREDNRMNEHAEMKNKNRIKEVVDLIINLLTYDDILPQGSPSSPFLFFLYLMEDPIIKFPFIGPRIPRGVWPCLVERVPSQYQISGYIDNVCISGKKPVPGWLKELSIKEFEKAGFGAHKIRETDIRHGSPMLCGLRISNAGDIRRVVLPKKEVRRIRAMIGSWKYSRGKLLARRIQGTISALKPIYGSLEDYPPQITGPLNEVGIENIIRVASE